MTVIKKSNLVIQTAFLGDLILSIPTLNRIKKIFPDDKLIVVCKQGLGNFLITENIVDEVIEVEKANSKSYNKALIKIKETEIENIFCLHKSFRSMYFTLKIKAKKKIGFKSLLGHLVFDEQVLHIKKIPEVMRQFRILETIDPETKKQFLTTDYIYLNNSTLPALPEFFSFSRVVKSHPPTKKIALFPGSVWATKKWTASGFAELAEILIKNNFEVHLLGGPSEKSLCNEIASQAIGAIVKAGSLSVAESIHELKNYDLVISNDSAPAHMAAYSNTPVITIFGPTILDQGFRPWSNSAAVVQNNTLECRPCGKHGHHQCPLGHHNCMKSIGADEVFRVALSLLSKK